MLLKKWFAVFPRATQAHPKQVPENTFFKRVMWLVGWGDVTDTDSLNLSQAFDSVSVDILVLGLQQSNTCIQRGLVSEPCPFGRDFQHKQWRLLPWPLALLCFCCCLRWSAERESNVCSDLLHACHGVRSYVFVISFHRRPGLLMIPSLGEELIPQIMDSKFGKPSQLKLAAGNITVLPLGSKQPTSLSHNL